MCLLGIRVLDIILYLYLIRSQWSPGAVAKAISLSRFQTGYSAGM